MMPITYAVGERMHPSTVRDELESKLSESLKSLDVSAQKKAFKELADVMERNADVRLNALQSVIKKIDAAFEADDKDNIAFSAPTSTKTAEEVVHKYNDDQKKLLDKAVLNAETMHAAAGIFSDLASKMNTIGQLKKEILTSSLPTDAKFAKLETLIDTVNAANLQYKELYTRGGVGDSSFDGEALFFRKGKGAEKEVIQWLDNIRISPKLSNAILDETALVLGITSDRLKYIAQKDNNSGHREKANDEALKPAFFRDWSHFSWEHYYTNVPASELSDRKEEAKGMGPVMHVSDSFTANCKLATEQKLLQATKIIEPLQVILDEGKKLPSRSARR